MGAIYHRGVKYTGVNMPDDYSIIGPEEKTATASRAYAVGEHFVKDGYFCTAKTAIAQGATLTLNTNYTQGDVAEATYADQTFNGASTNAQSGKAIANYSDGKFLKVSLWNGNTRTVTLPENTGTYLFCSISDSTGAVYYTAGTTITKMCGNNLPSSVVITRPNSTTIKISSTVSWGVRIGIMYLGSGTPTVSSS